MKQRSYFNMFIRFMAVMLFAMPFCASAQVDGEFRSVASGQWLTLTTWEKYTAATNSWATATAIPTGTTTIITVRAGHTVQLTGNYVIKKLTVQAGGSVIGDGTERRIDLGGDTSAVINNGNIGGISGSNDSKLNIANAATCTIGTISGTGTTSIVRVRFNASTATVVNTSTLIIDQDMTITSSGLTAFYNNASNVQGENCVITINAGRTVTASGALHASAVPVDTGGNYTYNINGTLDMSGTTTSSIIVPMAYAPSNITINVAGTWKVSKLDASATGLGSVNLNILNGGLVDAAKNSLFSLGTRYWTVTGTGKIKRAVPAATGAVTFPMGTSATAYNPLTITPGATSADDTFTVSLSNTLSNSIPNPAKIVTKQWGITPVGTGAGFTPTFGWVTADQAASFNPANPVSVFNYNGTTWAAISLASAISGSGTVAAPYTTTTATAPAALSGNYVVGNSDASATPGVTLTATPANTVCAGVPVTFTATTTNVTGPHYQFKVNGTNVGTDQATYTSSTLAAGSVVTVVVSATAGGPALATSAGITMTINPAADPGTISGSSSVCSGTTGQLTTTGTGGTWSSSNTAVATVSATGLVTGIIPGSVVISYSKTNSCGTVAATWPIAVTLGASAGVLSGATTLCQAATSQFTSTLPGGTWYSTNTAAATVSTTGLVTGVAAGTTTIKYVIVNGCGTDTAVKALTINGLPPTGSITGPSTVCVGSTITLANATTGGVWSANNGNVTITSAGVVTGVTAGTSSIISYTVTNGCGNASTTTTVNVGANLVVTPILGSSTACVGASNTLVDSTAGGTWSSATPSVLTISSTGVVTGVSAGTSVVTYAVAGGCGASSTNRTITVSALPTGTTVTGTDSVCVGATTTLFAGVTGGSWSSATGKTALTMDGIVTGITAGIDTVKYNLTNSCGTTPTRFIIRVVVCNPAGIRNIAGADAVATTYPNPNTGSFVYKLTSATTTPVKIIITDIRGAVVQTISANTNESINIRMQQPAGIYMLSAITDKGRNITKINVTQ